MNAFPMEVGRVVFSKAGRDAGHYFVVVEVLDEHYVAIANGCQRKVDNPKKKKIKHLVAKEEILEEISEKISGLATRCLIFFFLGLSTLR